MSAPQIRVNQLYMLALR